MAYKISYCVEWENPKFGWIVAQSFHSSEPVSLLPKNVRDQVLVPSFPALRVEVPEAVQDSLLYFNIRRIIHVDPEDLCKELEGLYWDKILDLSDGFWNTRLERGVVHPESNMGLETSPVFNIADKARFLAELHDRGNLLVQLTGEGYDTQAYYVGRDMGDIIARIQIHKVMTS